MTDVGDIKKEILRLKEEKDAVIIAHNYQIPDVQDVADMLGDSLGLARQARAVDNRMIVFCGVTFMAETAKILNPEKKVVIPEMTRCPMADMIDLESLAEMKREHPDAPVVAYVNTTAQVKAESDICVTSANAVDIVRRLDSDEVIFIPDQNLGLYVASQVPEKKVHIYPGYCRTHNNLITKESIKQAHNEHPDAKVMAHPECKPEVLELADTVESTGGMLRYVRESKAKEFIVGTEKDMAYRLQKEFPDRKFYTLDNAVCYSMKKITLESLLHSLKTEEYEIILDPDIARRAMKPVERMLEMSK